MDHENGDYFLFGINPEDRPLRSAPIVGSTGNDEGTLVLVCDNGDAEPEFKQGNIVAANPNKTPPYKVELDCGTIVAASEDTVDLRPTRFAVGQRVCCRVGDGTFAMIRGSISELWYREFGVNAPYQVQLDGREDRFIFAPIDNDRAIAAEPRFDVGTRVRLKMDASQFRGEWPEGIAENFFDTHGDEGWVHGTIESLFVPYGPGDNDVAPYRILLDNGAMVLESVDREDRLQELAD